MTHTESGPAPKDAFEYQAPTPEQITQITAVREALKTARDALLEHVPAGRCRALAITKIEECSMWSNKGIVFE
ncbi:Acb2/Tad1 domain-containing protein [Deinococcus marmoris]|uniref:Acb2/Tad1 domain-containing protein n=1 Tax=Deinococcus marmoris TaxID=249408 RepID=UPI00096AC2A4|nr:hypothetical protein [Deinococcus marmoris]